MSIKTPEQIAAQVARASGVDGSEAWERVYSSALAAIEADRAQRASDECAYMVGAPDPTPNVGPYCGLEDEGFMCTRSPDGHALHAAGTGERIAHVWEVDTDAS